MIREENNFVYIADSEILNQDGESAGMGLFANKVFNKGEYIANYDGLIIETDIAIDENYSSDYIVKYDDDWAIDAQDPLSCYGRYANDPIYKEMINAKIVLKDDTIGAELIATKKINKDEEIYISYGQDYWIDTYHFEMLNGEYQQHFLDNGSNKMKNWIRKQYHL